MQAFIVRPFGQKEGIDFEKVEELLILKALDEARVAGRSTQAVIEAGNIREDMFQQLLLADLVIADVSIHNANVFYELGIRHALRSRQTFLLRAKRPKAEAPTATSRVPFDLSTDRYMEYDPANPAGSVSLLAKAIQKTVEANRVDSPVFRSLPRLHEPPHEVLRPVPATFGDDLNLAASKSQGGKLGLYASETAQSAWEIGGLRLAGRKQFEGEFYASARRTWEKITEVYRDDLEANLLLGTIYQRLREPELADQSLGRVLANENASVNERTEALTLQARNAKVTGRKKLEGKEPREARCIALRSGQFEKARDLYAAAFRENLNHYYSGINALSMSLLLLELINAERNVWAEMFDSEDEARAAEKQLKTESENLIVAVKLSIDAARGRPEDRGDSWVELSGADYKFLSAATDGAAASTYEQVLQSNPAFNIRSTRDQLTLFQLLGVREPRVRACLERFPPIAGGQELRQAIVFTGHMVDAPDREKPRFPAAAESKAREIIIEAVRERLQAYPGSALGIAGGASGGDILFHEVCKELGVPTRVLLTLPEHLFEARSVAPSGAPWASRFHTLIANHRGKNEVQVLASTEALPGWMHPAQCYDVWQRTNVWLLEEAIAAGMETLTLLALWNQESGLSGGTQDFVNMATERGIAVKVLDAKNLLA